MIHTNCLTGARLAGTRHWRGEGGQRRGMWAIGAGTQSECVPMKTLLPSDLLFKYWSHSATIPPSRGIPVIRDTSFMFGKQNTLWTRTCREALGKECVWWLRDEWSHSLYSSFVTGWGQISCSGQILGVQVTARDHYTMTCKYWIANISSQQRCENSLVPGKHLLFFFFFQQ